jgi:hypothetical protein
MSTPVTCYASNMQNTALDQLTSRQLTPSALLFGPYHPPALYTGDRATCLFRDCDVVVTSWTDAPISWPRCLPVGRRGHPSLLVDAELARAIHSESASAMMHWWRVSVAVVWRWRKAFGICRTGTPGSALLVQAAAQLGADAMKEREWSAAEREERRQLALDLNYSARLSPGYNLGPWWSDEELALLGTAPDAEIAAKIGRAVEAVRIARTRRGIVSACDRRRRTEG